jgi:hypothetical protein
MLNDSVHLYFPLIIGYSKIRYFREIIPFLIVAQKAKKMLKMLGVEYISYHACLNDCILYINEYVGKEICPECGYDKYQKSKNKGKEHGPPHKILRHMLIIPRIQRLFHCKQLVMFQGWHASHRSDLGVM